MSATRELIEAVQKMAGTYDIDLVNIVLCTVSDNSNALTDFTIDCTPISGKSTTEMPKVKLNAEANDGYLVVPKIDSTVLVVNSSRNNYYVLMYSDIERIVCVIDTSNKYEFSADGFVFNGGSLGGLTKTLELKSQLDKVNAQLQAVITALSSWIVVPNDGGAALKTFFAAQISGKPAGTFTGIENTKIKQ